MHKVPPNDTYVVHHNDFDGGTSAGILFNRGIPRNNFIELEYKFDLDDLMSRLSQAKEIFIVDYSPTQELIDALWALPSCPAVFVFDHHPTTRSLVTRPNTDIFYRSGPDIAGCSLLWETLYPTTEAPWFVKQAAKYDSWSWITVHKDKMPGIVNSFYWEQKLLGHDMVATCARFILGEAEVPCSAIDDFEAGLLKAGEELKHGFPLLLKGTQFVSLNTYNPGSAQIARTFDLSLPQEPILAWYMSHPGVIKCSLRVAESSAFDAKAFCESFPGGGGHLKAAGFHVTIEEFAKWPWVKQG